MCSLKEIPEKSSLPNKQDEIRIPRKFNSGFSIDKKSRPRSRPIPVIPNRPRLIHVKYSNDKDLASSPKQNFLNRKRKDHPEESKIPVLESENFPNEAPSILSNDRSDRKFLKAKRKEISENHLSRSTDILQDQSRHKPILTNLKHEDKTRHKYLSKIKTFINSAKNEKLEKRKMKNDDSEMPPNKLSCVTVKKKSSRLKVSKSKSHIRETIKPILKPVISKLSDKRSKIITIELKKYNKGSNLFSIVEITNNSFAGLYKYKNSLSSSHVFPSTDVTSAAERKSFTISSSQNDRNRTILSETYDSEPNCKLKKDTYGPRPTSSYTIPKVKKKETGKYKMGKSKLITEMARDKSNSLKVDDNTKTHFNNQSDFEFVPKHYLQTQVNRFVNSFYENNTSNESLRNLPSMEVDLIDESYIKTSQIIKNLYVVIDTNVLIGDRNLLCDVRGRVIDHQIVLKLIIPYIVLQELDNMKNKVEEVRKKAQTAIKWINSVLNVENPNIIGQSIEEHLDAKAIFDCENGDDVILSCCLHCKKLKKDLVLLSNDVNLRNKAKFSNIEAFCSREFEIFISKLEEYGSTNKISEKSNLNIICKSIFASITETSYIRNNDEYLPILGIDNFNSKSPTVMPDLIQDHVTENSSEPDINRSIEENLIIAILGKVLDYTMKDAYGDLWEKIVFIKPPWSAIDILKCIEKHWIAIFIDKFPNEFKTIILQLLNILSENIQSAERTKLCNRKISFLIKFIDKAPCKEIGLLKANKNISELSDFTQCKLSPFHQSLDDQEVANTNSINISFLNNNDEKYINNSASCSHKDVPDNVCSTMIACQDFNSSSIRNSIMKLGEHATHLMQSLVAVVMDNNEVNGFQANSAVTSSLHSLRQTLVAFGYSMKSYADEFSSLTGKTSLSDQISNYWKLAGKGSPHISFSDENIHSWSHTNEGREFFMCCISDLEKIIQALDTVLASPTLILSQ